MRVAPRPFIMGKSVPLSPPATDLVPGKLALWEQSTPCAQALKRGEREICQRLKMLAFEFVIAMILLLKITSKKKKKREGK